jgi:hypothetical protein
MEPSRLRLCKIWGFHGGDYEERRLLGYKNPVRTSQETHYVSTSESSQLKQCKIWGFHSGDYEECRLLGYENPGRTSQENHYDSAIELSRLMLCKIWGFHSGAYEECSLMRCIAVSVKFLDNFRYPNTGTHACQRPYCVTYQMTSWPVQTRGSQVYISLQAYLLVSIHSVIVLLCGY